MAFGSISRRALVILDPLGQRDTAGLLLGLGPHGVVAESPLIALVGFVQPAPRGQRDAEHVLGPAELGVVPYGPAGTRRSPRPAHRVGTDFAEVIVGRRQLGAKPDGVPEPLIRFGPLALAFQGQAEVIVGRG